MNAINIDVFIYYSRIELAPAGYEGYEVDETLPVPKRTKIRHNQQPNIQQQASNTEELFPMCIDDNNPPENLDNGFENDDNGAPIRDKCMAILAFINKMKHSF